ncbi:MAG: hypothetical protein J0G28_15875 [Afipia sp.]|nr:hypothetical protein [Afipia sp.]OJW65176.1 MAG: hypothetical protein BGO65_14265 [Afipia sp. 64-13]
MPGVTLTRWTMAYFGLALVALVLAELLMAFGFGYPAVPAEAAETLVLVHVVAIGWLSLLLCGALFQFVPVLVTHKLYSDTLPLPVLVSLVSGLVLLIVGFLQMGGRLASAWPAFPAAAVLLSLGFGLALWNLGRTLWAARPLSLAARFVVVGLCSLGATVALGVIFALVLGGVTGHAHLIELTASGLPLHVIAGLGGWLTFSAMGVSYRLLAMFMLAPELGGPRTRAALYSGAAALAVAIAGGVAAICLEGSLTLILSVAGLLGLGCCGLYGADIVHLYRARMRRAIELNSRMASWALASLAVAVAAIIVLLGAGVFTRYVPAVVFLIGFGWLSGLGLAKLYKIVAFLTWLECYGPVLGKTPTPRVQDLAVQTRAVKWFALYFLAVWCATAALFVDAPLAFRICAGVMALASIGIIAELVRIRRLVDVKTALRLPPGVRLPRLLHCSVQHA